MPNADIIKVEVVDGDRVKMTIDGAVTYLSACTAGWLSDRLRDKSNEAYKVAEKTTELRRLAGLSKTSRERRVDYAKGKQISGGSLGGEEH